ncbi:MAG: LuxR C-terminal-related transcriptional regulator, partial [Pseudonocardiaceae bacterium]
AQATQARNPMLVCELLHRFGLHLWLTGSHNALRAAFEGIGEQAIAADPWLAVLSAMSHLEAGELAQAGDDLRHADLSGCQDTATDVAILRAAADVLQAHASGHIPSPRRSPEIATPPNAEPGVEALTRLIRAAACFRWSEDRSAARRELEYALMLASRHGFDYLTMQCRTLLGAVAAVGGDYHSMAAAGDDVVSFAAAHGWQHSLWSSTAYAMVANAALLRAEPVQAWLYSSQGLSYGETTITPAVRLALEVMRGAAVFDSGRPVEGLAAMQHARVHFGAAALTAEQAVGTALLEHRAAVLLGHCATAAGVLTWLLERADAPGEVLLMRAWTEISAGHHHAAGDLVRSVLSGADQFILPHSMVEALLADAALAVAAQEPVRAQQALQAALTQAEPLDGLRPFALAGPAVRQLLVRGLGTFGLVESFASRAVAASDRIAQPPPTQPVTERELAVLYLLPSLLSLEEIAEDLSISINTVKSHVRSIYAKLRVSSRRAAVVTAQEHGLLTTTAGMAR